MKSLPPILLSLLAALAVAGSAQAVSPAPFRQDAPAAPEAEDPAPAAPVQEGPSLLAPPRQEGLVRPEQAAQQTPIPDIDVHRSVQLPYVRTRAEVVGLDLGTVDIEADPVLFIGNRPVSRSAFRRRAIMYAGENELDRYITRLLTDKEMQRAIAAGADPAAFEVDDAAIDTRLEEMKELVKLQARQSAGWTEESGTPDPADAAVESFQQAIDSSIGMEAYRAILSADAQFEKVYLPIPAEQVEGTPHDFTQGPPPEDMPRPEWIPQVTWDALGASEQGRTVRAFIEQWAIEGTGIPAFFKTNILSQLRDGLLARYGVTFWFDAELPDDVVLTLGDEAIKVGDLWPLVAPQLADTDIELIVRELLTLEAMQTTLEAAGAWMDEATMAEQWAEEEAKYAGTFIPLKSMIMFRGYSSLDRYREHFRYRQAYNLWRRQTLTDDEVQEHYQGGGRVFFERGNAIVDVAYAPLGDRSFGDAAFEQSQQGLLDAMAEERETAGEAADAAPSEQTPGWFAGVMERYPGPPARPPLDGHNMQRTQLRIYLAEDELSIFLTGYSLADDIFYHGRSGDLFGPWPQRCRRHAFGAEANAGSWLVYLRGFSRRQPLSVFEGRAKDLAYEDFLDLNYFYWAQESLKTLLPRVKLPDA
jgi:hypothetical protein